MTSKTDAVKMLREIVGTTKVLTDVEDLYVYSFDRIYRKRHIQEVTAVIKTDTPEEIEKVTWLAKHHGFPSVQRSETFEFEKTSKPIILLDDSKQLDLKPLEKSEETHSDEVKEFHEAERGTKRKLALAQKLMFLDKAPIKCMECNVCTSYCTVANSFNGVETWSAKGRMLLIKGLTRKELSISPKILDVIYTCSNCGLCFVECLQRSGFQEAIRAARRQIVLEGFAPDILKVAAKNILEVGDPGGTSPIKRFSWRKTVPNSHFKVKAPVLYWVGCTLGTRTPNTARAVTNILSFAASEVALLGKDEGCCGYVLLASGLWDEARKNAENLIETIGKTKAETIVTSCAGCHYTFSKLFPEILDVEMPCEILHASELIENLMREGQVDLAGVNERVTFHDPCALGRHSNVYDAPRNVLSEIPELQFVEMPLSRNQARCCGGGGGLWSYNNKVSLNSALNRLTKDVIPLNVNVLATACPTCQMNLRIASNRNSIPIKVCDFAEIAEKAILNAAVN